MMPGREKLQAACTQRSYKIHHVVFRLYRPSSNLHGNDADWRTIMVEGEQTGRDFCQILDGKEWYTSTQRRML
jgi:hypothetical protein